MTTNESNYSNLHQLLILKLSVLKDVEEQIVKALPKMADAASDPDLRKLFTDHLEETQKQSKRLDECFSALQAEPVSGDSKSEGIRGIIEDGEWVIKNIKVPAALDACLISAAQSVEHFEMAGYGTASEWAGQMKHVQVKEILGKILEEEKAADEKLSKLAAFKINKNADVGLME